MVQDVLDVSAEQLADRRRRRDGAAGTVWGIAIEQLAQVAHAGAAHVFETRLKEPQRLATRRRATAEDAEVCRHPVAEQTEPW